MKNAQTIKPRLEVITGSMFSGKTEELIRRLRRLKIAGRKVQVFKPAIDSRYDLEAIASHVGGRFEAEVVTTMQELLASIRPDTEVIGIEEVQFFGPDTVDQIEALVTSGKHVIVGGLDTDFRAEPFPPLPTLMALADSVTKLEAICMVCKGSASRTQRLVAGKPAPRNSPLIEVGASDAYEARCRSCYQRPQ